jgi:hypothetical protein
VAADAQSWPIVLGILGLGVVAIGLLWLRQTGWKGFSPRPPGKDDS